MCNFDHEIFVIVYRLVIVDPGDLTLRTEAKCAKICKRCLGEKYMSCTSTILPHGLALCLCGIA